MLRVDPPPEPARGRIGRRGRTVLAVLVGAGVIVGLGVAVLALRQQSTAHDTAGPSEAQSNGWPAEPASSPPRDWAYMGWEDPALEVALPAAWERSEPAPNDVSPSESPAARKALEASNELIGSGAIRLYASGPFQTGTYGSIEVGFLVFVQAGDSSLGACADRIGGWIEQSFTSNRATRRDLVLRGIPMVRLDWWVAIWGEPSAVSSFLAWLPDGRCLVTEFDWGPLTPAMMAGYEAFPPQVLGTLRTSR